MMEKRIISLSSIALAAHAFAAADPLDNLHYLTPEPLPMLQDIAYGGGRWLALAADVGTYKTGILLMSTNGTEWTRSAPGTFPEYFKPTRAIYAGGLWTMAGVYQGPHTNAPALMKSTDGVTWQTLDFGGPSSGFIQSLQYGNGLWLAMTSDNYYYTSTDGDAWTSHAALALSLAGNVIFGGGTWLAITPFEFYHSTNAIDWTAHNAGLANPVRVAFGNGRWAGVGFSGQAFVTSEDAVNWTPTQFISKDNDIYDVIYANGTWLAFGEDRSNYLNSGIRQALLWTSTNGIQWTRTLLEAYGPVGRGATDGQKTALIIQERRPGEIFTSTNLSQWTPRLHIPAAHYSEGVYADGTWLVIGSQFIGQGTDTRKFLMHSANGLAWQRVFPGELEPGLKGEPGGTSWHINQGGGQFVLSGRRSIATSSNGIHWVRQEFPYESLGVPQYANGLWVIPVDTADFETNLFMLTSTNALHWTEIVTTGQTGVLFRVTFGGGRWIGQADGSLDGQQYLVTSVDGQNWSRLPDLPFNRDISYLGFANGSWLLGRLDPSTLDSTLYTSDNGSSWTPREVFPGFNPAFVTESAGRWFVTSFDPQTGTASSATSTNGVQWQLTSYAPLFKIGYAGGRWISSDPYGIASSTNGISWVVHHSIETGGVITDSRRVVFTGERISSAMAAWNRPLLSLSRQGASWNVRVRGDLGATYQLERNRSLDPLQWENAGTITLQDDASEIVVPASTEPRMFWRATIP